MGRIIKYSPYEMIRLYSLGKSPQEIGRLLGCTRQTVINRLKEAAIYMDGRGNKPEGSGVKKGYHKVTEKELRVIALKQAGYSYTDIANKLQMPRSTVTTIYLRYKKRKEDNTK